MQKVEGSSPFSRFDRGPAIVGLLTFQGSVSAGVSAAVASPGGRATLERLHEPVLARDVLDAVLRMARDERALERLVARRLVRVRSQIVTHHQVAKLLGAAHLAHVNMEQPRPLW